MTALLEHVNITCPNPDETATWMCEVFGWHVRWAGPSLGSGRTVHVGTDTNYIALYRPAHELTKVEQPYSTIGDAIHIAVVVEDLADAEKRIIKAGFETHSHADYEPGQRFYFQNENNMEYEVVSYQANK